MGKKKPKAKWANRQKELPHVGHHGGLEVRWGGIYGAIGIFSPEGELLKSWTAEQNQDGSRLLEAIHWARGIGREETEQPAAEPEPAPED